MWLARAQPLARSVLLILFRKCVVSSQPVSHALLISWSKFPAIRWGMTIVELCKKRSNACKLYSE